MQVPAEAASAGDDNHDTEHNSTASGGMHESEESADEPELLPDSWETMAEEAAGHKSVQQSAGMPSQQCMVQSGRVGLSTPPIFMVQ